MKSHPMGRTNSVAYRHSATPPSRRLADVQHGRLAVCLAAPRFIESEVTYLFRAGAVFFALMALQMVRRLKSGQLDEDAVRFSENLLPMDPEKLRDHLKAMWHRNAGRG